jgi:glucose/arabinose dehydrogenase
MPILAALRFAVKMPGGGLRLLLACVGCIVVSGVAVPAASAIVLPSGFQADTLEIPRAGEGGHNATTGLQSPVALDFAPDGSMYVGDHNGTVMFLESVDDTTPTLTADLSRYVMDRGDWGLLGLKLDPEFPAQPYVYVSYTFNAPKGGEPPPGPGNPNEGDGCRGTDPNLGCLSSGRIVRIQVNPATGVAVGGPVDPPQDVLVESWCVQFTSHSMGDIEFDSSGALLAGGGDGAEWGVADHGQFANACGDPDPENGPVEGGSLRSQDLRTPETPTDPTDYSGSIVRVDRATGDPLPDNPLFESEDVGARRILAYGMRNPFRFELRPGTDELYVGDVGWYTWEELDRASSPPAPGQPPINFGWPCYEGLAPEPDWHQLAQQGLAPLCQSLYDEAGAGVTAPIFTYVHSETQGLFPGDGCPSSPGSSMSGLAFYEPPATASAREFPASYDGALFIADASRGCIWTMSPDPQGVPDPTSVTNFATPSAGASNPFVPVDITEGPEGALYVPNFADNSITRIRYFAEGEPPVAELSADRTFGATAPTPLSVSFDASASSDPEGGPLLYEWDLNGDGIFGDAADDAAAEWQYHGQQNVNVSLRVTDTDGNSDETHLTIYPGDLGPPVPEVSVGPEDWAIGETIHFSAGAVDPDAGEVPAFDWNVTIKHCPFACHTHPFALYPDTDEGSFSAPPHEYPSHLDFALTARDERGLSTVVSRDLYPRTAALTMESQPPGIDLAFDALEQPAPFEGMLIAGGNANVSAPQSAEVGGVAYEFESWSDGGERSHTVTVSASTQLSALYRRVGAEAGKSETPAQKPPDALPPEPLVFNLRSKPPGISLRVGEQRQRAPLRVELDAGLRRLVTAPRRVVVGNRVLRFRRWEDGAARRRWLEVGSPASLVAIYGFERLLRRR